MASSTSRQPGGHSRKAQISVFTGYALAAAGAMVGLVLLIVAIWHPGPASTLQSEAADIAAPAGEVGAGARVGTGNIFDRISGFYRAGSRNAEMAEELKIARVRLAEAKAIEQENLRLKATLELKESLDEAVTTARLIGSTSASARRIAYLSAGRDDGVRPGMPVRSPLGLVGRVLDAGDGSARVLLLSDTESMVPVRRATDNVVAFAEGRGDGTLRLRLVNLGLNPLEPGDVFVTSGAGGLFRPGIAVAIAGEKTTDGALGSMISDPAATDYVVVEKAWQGQALEELARKRGKPGEPVEPTEQPAEASE